MHFTMGILTFSWFSRFRNDTKKVYKKSRFLLPWGLQGAPRLIPKRPNQKFWVPGGGPKNQFFALFVTPGPPGGKNGPRSLQGLAKRPHWRAKRRFVVQIWSISHSFSFIFLWCFTCYYSLIKRLRHESTSNLSISDLKMNAQAIDAWVNE